MRCWPSFVLPRRRSRGMRVDASRAEVPRRKPCRINRSMCATQGGTSAWGRRRLAPRLGRPKIGRASSTIRPTCSANVSVGGVEQRPRRPPAAAAPPPGSNRPGPARPAPRPRPRAARDPRRGPRWVIRRPARASGDGGEEDLEVGIGKDHRADVPAVHDDVPAGPHHGPEPRVDPLADHRHRRHRRHARRSPAAPRISASTGSPSR